MILMDLGGPSGSINKELLREFTHTFRETPCLRDKGENVSKERLLVVPGAIYVLEVMLHQVMAPRSVWDSDKGKTKNS